MHQPNSLMVAKDIHARAHADAAREHRQVSATRQDDTMTHGKRWTSQVVSILRHRGRAADRLRA